MLSEQRTRQIRQTAKRATLSGVGTSQQRVSAINEGVDLSSLNLKGRQELTQAAAQLIVEATETNLALIMEGDL